MRKRIRAKSNLDSVEDWEKQNIRIDLEPPKTRHYRINKKGEKRRILFSIPLVSLVLFVVILYLLSVEIYSNYNPFDMNELITDFNIQLSKSVIEDLDNYASPTKIWDFSNSYSDIDLASKKEEKKRPYILDSELTKLRIDDDLFMDSVSDVGVESKVISQNNYVTGSG